MEDKGGCPEELSGQVVWPLGGVTVILEGGHIMATLGGWSCKRDLTQNLLSFQYRYIYYYSLLAVVKPNAYPS